MGKRRREDGKATFDSLSWKHVDVQLTENDHESNMSDGMGVFGLETVAAGGYDIVDGKLIFKDEDQQQAPTQQSQEEQQSTTAQKKKKKARKRKKKKKGEAAKEQQGEEPAVALADMSEWAEFGLNQVLVNGLEKLKYATPTPIQRLCLPKAIRNGVDVLGAAETGSGKTLAFGLPVLNGLLADPPGKEDGLAALILTPTRELAVQVTKHMRAVVSTVNIGTIVGGMSQQKQERVLAQKPQIIVATPGRLWSLIENGNEHLSKIGSTLRYLVVDEADRMFEQGHFPDLKPLVRLLCEGGKPVRKRQTLLFSATLLLESATHARKKRKKSKGQQEEKAQSPLLELMDKIGLRGKPAICRVDNTKEVRKQDSSKVSLPSNLKLSSVHCLDKEKDYYLYYFVSQYPGRCLVFVNTISSLRRVAGTLKVLGVKNVTTLHANIQQKQRLKHLERFTRESEGILVATDVAARGLDISGIDCVVNYAVPKNTDTFVHRSGRTARATANGLSLSLVGPSESATFERITSEIGKIQDFPVQMACMPAVKDRVILAKRIQFLERKHQDAATEKNWFVQNAKAADIELDEERVMGKANVRQKASQEKEIKSLRRRLEMFLAQRMLPLGTSTRYISPGSNLVHSKVRNAFDET